MTSLDGVSSQRISCETCLQMLNEYVGLELENQPAEERFPDVAFHIEICPDCEAAYFREFRRQGLQKTERELRPIGHSEGVDRSLQQILASTRTDDQTTESADWRQVALDYGRGWIDRATEAWQQVELFLGGLTSGTGLEPSPALAGLMGGERGEEEKSVATISLAPDEADFDLHIAVIPDEEAGKKDTCRLEVAVTLHQRFGDYSGAKVTLYGGEAPKTATTDEQGKVQFSGIPCDQVKAMRLLLRLPEE